MDPATDRVYVDHLNGACSWLSYSDDAGDTWVTNPIACGRPVNDHQKIGFGPANDDVPQPAHPRTVYYCWNEFAGVPGQVQTGCSASYDGGVTWPVTRHLATERCDSGFVGNVVSGPNGTVYAANSEQCDRGPVVWTTDDAGRSWTSTPIDEPNGTESIDPDVAVDERGTAYLVYRTNDHVPRLTYSTDEGETWSNSTRVAPPGIRSTVFQAIAAGDAGRVAVAYLGTNDTAKGADDAPDRARWHLYITTSLDADQPDPTFATVRATEDPVQIGCFGRMFQDEDGGDCSNGNHLDFIDAVVGPEGRFYAAINDGCDGCSSADGSTEQLPALGVTTGGPRLFADTPVGANATDAGGPADEGGARSLVR